MNRLFSRHILLLAIAAALLIFAIRFFETAFHAGEVSTKLYITFIGIIFLTVGAYAATQMVRKKTIIHYVEQSQEAAILPNDLLTERECEVLKAIAVGLTNKQIGQLLFVSENTVKKHINHIYFKLDVNRRTQAVARAKELKILNI